MSGGATAGGARSGTTTAAGSFIGRRERFALVGSTNDIVRAWLAAGEPEICLAVADRQAEGRGRAGRTWVAPDGAALLLSLGFRPAWLAPDRTWRLVAVVALAMADAAEAEAGLPPGAVRLKWPNDLVVEDGGPADLRPGIVRKLAGLLGETDGLGSADPRATIGLGVNVAWPPAAFPADLAGTMTSLSELTGRPAIDESRLLEGFLSRLEPRVATLRAGDFDAEDWTRRQLTSGRTVRLEQPDGSVEVVAALGVDPDSGALVVGYPGSVGASRRVFAGEIGHVRLEAPAGPMGERVRTPAGALVQTPAGVQVRAPVRTDV